MDGTTAAAASKNKGLRSFDIQITGMTCGSCAGRVEKALNALDTVSQASVNLATEKAHIEVLNTPTFDPSQLIATVKEAGYQAVLADTVAGSNLLIEPVDRREQVILVLSVLMTAPFMAQMVLMPTPYSFELPVMVQLILASVVQFGPGSRFYGPAWRALKAGTGNMDTLVVMGTTATWALSTFVIWSKWPDASPHALYFEASATVITLILVGKYLETKARRAASAAIKGLSALQPETARVRQHGEDREVALSHLKVGDILVVKPGERIAADAQIIEGISHVDESFLTGESLPVAKSMGDALIGGAINGEGLLLAKTLAVGGDSKLAQIIKRVELAQTNKPPVQRLVDRIAAYFVPFIVVVAVATCIGWVMSGESLETAIIYAATVLVIACPCALGLATPTAIMVGTGAAAKSGILIRDMTALESARTIDCVVFDKTGTLTEGKPKVLDVKSGGIPVAAFMSLIAAAQRGSEHPLARAVACYATDHQLDLPATSQFQAIPGRGLSAQVGDKTILIGSKRLMTEKQIDTGDLERDAITYEKDGNTVVWVADHSNQVALGIIAIGDTIRVSAASTIANLRSRSIETVLLSGDNRMAAEKVAATLGINQVIAEVLPDEKASQIEVLKRQGYTVAMVGDGINDAPALAVADLGIAMGSGTDVAMETAGITLMRTDPSAAVDAMDISAATYSKIRQNLFWAFIYNVIAIPLAVFGVLTPIIAGAAMALSSVSVVSNSLLLKRWHAKGTQT